MRKTRARRVLSKTALNLAHKVEAAVLSAFDNASPVHPPNVHLLEAYSSGVLPDYNTGAAFGESNGLR